MLGVSGQRFRSRSFNVARRIQALPSALLALALAVALCVPAIKGDGRMQLVDDPVPTQPAAWSSTLAFTPASVSTLAGTDAALSTDGPAGVGSFANPIGMTVAGGFGYLVDNGYIRKVDLATGAVSTVAGGASGCTDSTDPTHAGIGFAGGNTVSDGSYLYFPDASCGYFGQGGMVRRMDLTTGAVSTLPGGRYAQALTIGPDGALYLSTGNSQIYRLDLQTMTQTLYLDLPAQPASRGDLAIGVIALAADASSLWVQARGANPPDQFNGIFRVDPGPTPTLTTVVREDTANGMYSDGPMVSAGGYLYAVGAWSRILRIDKSTGATLNIAGASDGYRDGVGAQAWFRGTPSGIDTDGTSLYLDDVGNRRIRKLIGGSADTHAASPLWQHTIAMSAGAVSTLAGTGSTGSADGPAGSATFGTISGPAISDGFGYVLDSGRIRRLDLATGDVTTMSGDGSGNCLDSADPGTAGIGQPWGPPATDGQFLYWEDSRCGLGSGAGELRRASLATGAVSTIKPIRYGQQVTVGPDGSLVTARDNHLAKVDPVSGVETAITDLPSQPVFGGTFAVNVVGLTSDADSIWVSATEYNGALTFGIIFRVQILSTGTVVTTVVRLQTPQDNGTGPIGALVSAGDFLYAAGTYGRLLRFTKSDGSMQSVAGASSGFQDGTGAEGWFASVDGIDTDGTTLYLGDAGNHRIRQVAVGTPAAPAQPADWSASTDLGLTVGARVVAGTGDSAITDGPVSSASFSSLTGLSVAGGYGYTYDQGRIRKINLTTGAVATVAGSGVGCADNPVGVAALNGTPERGLVNDGRFLYWSDSSCGAGSGTGVLRRMSLATGAVSTVHGNVYLSALTTGPDGSLLGFSGNNLVRIDPDSGAISQPLATLPDQTVNATQGIITINGITADGHDLYVCGHITNPWVSWGLVDKIDLTTGQVSLVWEQAATGRSPDGPIVSAGDQLYLSVTGIDLYSGIANYRGISVLSKSGGTQLEPLSGGTAGGPLFLDGQYLGGGNVTGLDVHGGTLYAAATGTRRLYQLTSLPVSGPTGFEATAGNNPAEDARCGRCEADPVDLDSGNAFGYAQDLVVPGRGEILDLTRSYDTRMAGIDGPFGYGWSDPYHLSLTVDTSSGPTQGQVTIHQANGSQVTFYPFGSDYYAKSSVFATLRRDSAGLWYYQVRGQQVYHFDSSGRYTAVESMTKYATNLDYVNGRLADVRETDQRELTFAYNGQGRVSAVTDPAGRTVSYGYDAAGNLTDVTDVDGRHWSYGYDANHRLTSVTDPRGHSVTTSYDTAGRATEQTDRDGGVVQIGYGETDSDGSHATTVTHANGTVDQYLFRNHQVVSETHGFGSADAATTSYQYDPATGSLSQVTDPLGNVTTMSYDAAGNLTRETDPLGNTVSASYNSYGEPVTETDQLGVTTTYTYSADHGVLLTISTPLVGTDPLQQRVITFGHTDAVHPDDVGYMIDPDGQRTDYGYDSYGNLVAITDPTGRVTTAAYSVVGFLTSVTDAAGNVDGTSASGHTTTFSDFTGFGKPRTVTDELGRQQHFTYDADQNLISITDGDQVLEQYGYNNSNEQISITDAGGNVQSTGYDANGNIVSQTDALGHNRTRTYDALNRLASQTDPLGHTTSYGYDLASRLTSVRTPDDQGGTSVTTNGYDADGRLITISYDDGSTPPVSYAYDRDSQRIGMTDGSGTTSYHWDSLRRLSSETDGNGAAVEYGYDLAGNRTSLRYPGTAQPVLEGRDGAGRLTSVTDPVGNETDFGYDADGNLARIGYPNGVVDTRTFDGSDRPVTVTSALGTTALVGYSYSYSPGTRLASAAPSAGALGSENVYTYTATGRLATDMLDGRQPAPGWTYDADGRMTSAPSSSYLSSYQLSYNDDDSVADSGVTTPDTSYGYDVRGSRTSYLTDRSRWEDYSYDQADRLTTVTDPLGTAASYTYNGDGDRMTKTVRGASAQHMVWDHTTNPERLLSDGVNSYLYGPDGPIEQIDATGNPTYLHSDGRGSTVLLTDSTGNPVGRYQYGSYGTVVAQTGSVVTPLQYNGEYTDSETGFSYLRARYYDPVSAQFLTVDPLVDTTRSAYGYTDGDPVNYDDPNGLKKKNAWSYLLDPLKGKVSGSDVFDWVSDNDGPFKPMVDGFKLEVQQYDNGCSPTEMFWTGLKGTVKTDVDLYTGAVKDGALESLENTGHPGAAGLLKLLDALR